MLELMKNPWVITVIACLVIIILIMIIIQMSQIRKVKKDIKSMTESDVNHNMTRKPSKVKWELRWVDILMAGAFIAVIVLVFVCVICAPKANDTSMDIAVITISFTMAAIIPYIIGNSIAKNEVNHIVDKKFETLENKYSTSLFSLTKQNAHTKRMCANLLKKSSPKWAIGWISEALISYNQIEKEYDGSKYIAECIDILHELTEEVMKTANSGRDQIKEEEKNINERTLRSILTMHAYLITDNSPILKDLRKLKSGYVPYDEIIQVERALIQSMYEGNRKDNESIDDYIKNREFKEFCKSCKISDLIDRKTTTNEAIEQNVIDIICDEYPSFKEAVTIPTHAKRSL